MEPPGSGAEGVHEDIVGELLDAYDIGEELGRGAWGIVRRARHRQLDRPVAIKQLSAAFGGDPAVRARFAAEARLIASLDHPHIVPAYDYVERDGSAVIVMEYLPGGTLWQRFRSRGVAPQEAVAYLLAVASALHFAHERAILHRDVKPDNLLFNSRGVLKLTDFGLAGVLSAPRSARSGAGTVVGTPAYIAPERIRGEELAPASDVYSGAVVLYELLAGRLPFPAPTDPLAQLYQHVYESPQPLCEVAPEIPARLSEVVMRALQKKPAARYEGADLFGIALAEAARAAWGPGWLQATGVAVMDAHSLAAAPEAAGRASAAMVPPALVPRGAGSGQETLVASSSRVTLASSWTARDTDPGPVPHSPQIELSPEGIRSAPPRSKRGALVACRAD
jgi:serine/threonine-protein kinase